MGRPLKIQKLNNSIPTDVGFNSFAKLDPTTAVIPVGMTSTEFLGVVGGSNTNIATSTFPVVAITANVNGQQGAAHIITQKGQIKYLVSGEDSVYANSLTQGFAYQITNIGTGTNWTALGAGINPAVGQVFTCALPLGQGTGNGQASDAGQCTLVTTNAISAGQMYMTLTYGNTTSYASRLTNKYIWDSANVRYAVNFFVANGVGNSSVTTTKSGADAATFSGNTGNITIAQVSNYTS
jgi:hypothetical protein